MTVILAAISLELGDYGLFAGLLAAFGSLGVALLQGNIKALATRIDRIEDRIAAVEKTKTDKHDWARETLLSRTKMTALGEQISRVDAKLDSNFGIAASVNRLTDELCRRESARPRPLPRGGESARPRPLPRGGEGADTGDEHAD